MLNPRVHAESEQYREAFATARPFRHVLIEDFLDHDSMASLYEEFPAFTPEHALNEFGEVGGKAVVTDLQVVSPAYKALYRYLNSQAFLQTMSDLTGISDLLPDPDLYGGGTHENIEGQELDPHVDYNYLNGGQLHRRLNLLVYFNKEWEEDWGGCIELHSNPRRPEQNEVTSFLPLYNRALIFETNEHSWHGFKRIQLPESHKGLSRKSLAVYLYTRTRPEEEVAPPHSTFYVSRPLPDYIRPGHQLTEESLQEIRNLLQRRDDWIEFYQNKELRDSATIQELERQLSATGLARVLAPGHLARTFYHRMPLSLSRKEKCKHFLFKHFGMFFKNTRSYRHWQGKQYDHHQE